MGGSSLTKKSGASLTPAELAAIEEDIQAAIALMERVEAQYLRIYVPTRRPPMLTARVLRELRNLLGVHQVHVCGVSTPFARVKPE